MAAAIGCRLNVFWDPQVGSMVVDIGGYGLPL